MDKVYWHQVLLVGSGGFAGSAARFIVSGWVYRLVPSATLPYGTFAVNILGCFAIGLLGGLAEVQMLLGPSQRVFLLIGVLGGFTTFSTFAFETFGLAQDSELLKALVNVAAQVVGGLCAAWAGFAVARLL
jgi:fluoride exporter